MKKALIGIALLLTLAISGAASAADPAGYALLDRFVVQFEQMARQGTAAAAFETALDEMMAMTRRAQKEARVDAVFIDRYSRLLRVLKLVTTKDPEGILRPVAEREIGDLVQAVTGERKTDIGSLAQAITLELDSLRKHLDGK